MTGLAGVLSLTVAGVIVAVLIAAICITRRKIVSQKKGQHSIKWYDTCILFTDIGVR